MSRSGALRTFVRDALAAGRSRAEIDVALREAGWAEADRRRAMSAFHDGVFLPPVPRPRAGVDARDLFVQGLLFGTLAAVAINATTLLHALIEVGFAEVDPRGPRATVRWALADFRGAVAALVVVVPIHAWLAWWERRRRSRDPVLVRSALKRWMTYATLLVASGFFIGALVTVVHQFLTGDPGAEALLKAGAVALVSGGVFAYARPGEEA